MKTKLAILLLTVSGALGQALHFDVASFKDLPGEQHGGGFQVTPTSVAFHGYPLGFMIRWAYGQHPYQAFEISGPAWLEPGLGCVRFDVIGKVDRPATVDELRLRMRTLLAERLQLALHREVREMTVAVLSVGRDGPRLRKSELEEMTAAGDMDLMHFKGAQMARLDEWLYQIVPYLIVDETALRDRYDFDLNLQQFEDLAMPGPGGRTDKTAVVNKALQPLGLKLEQKRRPVEILVIDHAGKVPIGN